MIRVTDLERLAAKATAEMEALRKLSARIGRNPLLAQGSSGNTSIKIDGALWIKASGKWLAQAEHEEIFVPLNLEEARRCVWQGKEIPSRASAVGSLRPSVETAMHAVLEHKVVLHVHSISAIAWAIRRDAPAQIAQRLAGLAWAWVPFVASGLPLALQARERMRQAPETNILVLGNHGLVVCGEDCESAEALLQEVERRLVIEPRRSPVALKSILKRTAKPPHWRLPDCETLHILGTDETARRVLRAGVLYPCQEIFLGRTLSVPVHAASLAVSGTRRYAAGQVPRFIIVQDAGVIVSNAISKAELTALRGLADVLLRTSEFALLRYLSPEELAAVRSDGAEGYRESAMAGNAVGQVLCR